MIQIQDNLFQFFKDGPNLDKLKISLRQHPCFCKKGYNQKSIVITNNIIFMMQGNNSQHQYREISSSEDRCKCAQCREQADLQLHNSKPVSNIYLHRHLKKREGPPDKKEPNKDTTHKYKMPPKAEGETKLAATPGKHKTDRSKEANLAGLTSQYHMVSHSQRLKLARQNQLEIKREQRLRMKGKLNKETLNLAQVSQNLESIKVENRKGPSAQRARIEASPNGANLVKTEAPRLITQK